MRHNKFKIEAIEIGGEVLFDNILIGKNLVRNNQDRYWLVTGKDTNQVLVSLKYELGEFNETIDVADISYYNKPSEY